jgi:predicted transcriptional regulator
MQRLWEAGRASIRQLADALYGADAGAAQYATVQKQLERLEAKGFVARDRSLYVHVFSPRSTGTNSLAGASARWRKNCAAGRSCRSSATWRGARG